MSNLTIDIGPNLLAAITLVVVTTNAILSLYLHRRNVSDHAAISAEVEATRRAIHDYRDGGGVYGH